ncbi:ribonuclease P protein subunit p25a [Polymixia lowei]
MELQSASFNPTAPSSSSPSQLNQNNFKRVSRTEDSSPFPIPGLAADILHMRVKEGSKIRNLLRFAATRMQEEGKGRDGKVLRQVVFTGSGRGVTKTITCVEILKRKLGGLHQVSKLHYKTVNEVWEGLQHGIPGITMRKTVPAISILLSKDPLDPQEPGYQPPQALNTLQEDKQRVIPGATCSPPSHAKRACLEDWSINSPSTSSK